MLTKTKIHYSSARFRKTGSKKHQRRGLSVFKINAILLPLWIIACLMYVATLNDMTIKAYKAKKLEAAVSSVSDNNQDLSLSVSNKQSMETVSQKVKALGLVEEGSVKYVAMPLAAVAKK